MKRIVNACNKVTWGKRAYAVLVLCATTTMALPGQTLTVLHSFDSTDGFSPFAGLVQGADGNLYGTTNYGGAAPLNCPAGITSCGTIFKITPAGTLTSLHSFDGTDGAYPGGLVLATDGNLYGTTSYDGAYFQGTVFKVTASGTLTTLSSLSGGGTGAALIQATNGNFYGTTPGTIFEFHPGSSLMTLYSFSGTDGSFPEGGLVEVIGGTFYGTTREGGSSSACSGGCGTIFKITPSGTLTTVYNFESTDGAYPAAALVQAIDGDLYGTTYEGGSTACHGVGCGTIFKLTPGGTLTVLHRFDDSDGGYPEGWLLPATDGSLYGTTSLGGSQGGGTIFKISPSGSLTTIYEFGDDGGPVGPAAGLVQATNGIFYGTTTFGGTSTACYNGCGTVFSLSVGLGPFVKTLPRLGKVGAAIKILGTDLTGATSVAFNGIAATFSVVSPSLITTTVPVGATTGTVQVVTPSGTLSGNGPFRVP